MGGNGCSLIEGLPAILLVPVVLSYMTEHPADAKWLRADEREWLVREMEAEQAEGAGNDRHARAPRSARSGCG